MITRTKDIMTSKLVTVPVGTSLADAQEMMDENRFRHLPVIDDGGVIVGVLSARDYGQFEDLDGFSLEELTVEYFMNAPVEYVNQNMPVRNAVFKMLEKKISSLVVADDNEIAVGIVTTDDLLWHLAHLLKEDDQAANLLPLAETIGGLATTLANSGI